ncbi:MULTISPECIES: hypothetical protein [Bradyrhizobium]|uniref:hypothetical protein n=1 Tax=Bradyrhizobium TaxID=374 RepID=UPI00155E9B92|nr:MULTISPECIES: hypothetical protein [Bradyrhizobium]UUO26093.1 hypothetical protein DCG74_01700 [Bradyrhizobium sp. WBAH42]
MLIRGFASIIAVLFASSAAFGKPLSYDEVLDFLTTDRWGFRCPGWVSGEGHVGLQTIKDGVTAIVNIKVQAVEEWLPIPLGDYKRSIPIRPASNSFPSDLKTKSVCGTIFGLGGCFLVDRSEQKIKLHYFGGERTFLPFDGPDNSKYCELRRVLGS